MDKNTITGFFLIGAIIVIFSIINRPTAEQIEQRQRMLDSIALEEMEREALSEYDLAKSAELESATATEAVTDFFAAGSTATEEIEADTAADEEVVASTTEVTDLATKTAEEFITLENEKIELVLSTLGGKIHSVRLKNEKRYTGDSLYLFEGDEASFNMEIFNRNSVRLSTEQLYFKPIVADNSVTMRLEQSDNQYIDFVYTLPADEYMMDFDIRVVGMKHGLHPESLTNLRVDWTQKIRQQEQGRTFENRFARINYKYQGQKVQRMSNNKAEKKELSEPVTWFAFKDQFFSSVIIAENPFANTVLETENAEDDHIKHYKAETWVPVTMDPLEDLLTASFKYYFGINHYYTLRDYDKGVANKEDRLQLHNLVDLGYKWLSWVNKYFTIPVFNYFLGLKWSMGLIILIMTIMIKLIVLPMTFKSFKSSAKMRVLRPQVQAIEAKYPGDSQDVMMKRQQATMELYSKAGASPMSGCLPMLLQMPILMAFFFFFPSAIELRGQSFLWAHDLSTYDALIQWNFHIPFIGKLLGNHLSIFCLMMTTVNIIYTRYNMQATDTGSGQMAGMKYMPFFMSGMMFFILNSYPAGLNYYYFLSTLITILLTIGFKRFLNEDKLLAEMEAKKKKPKKKSGFMARLEEAQKMQEKEMRERAKQQAKRNQRR